MRWSTRFIIPGVLIMALGCLPLALGHFDDFALEYAASLVTVGFFLLVIGLGLRRVRKALEPKTAK